jgi:oxygen-independent coproporphyrinogen-3 oxidase
MVAAQYDNWNIDLIFGAPPIEAWQATLDETVAISPPHVAAYGLTYEAGTPFERKQHEALDSDNARTLYQQLENALGDYDHYEISNFAKPDLQSRHNLIYWHNAQYAGFGTGAYSYINGVRARNHPTLEAYLQQPGDKCEILPLSTEDQQVETVIQYLRLKEGLPKTTYLKRFGSDIHEHYDEILKQLEQRGLIIENNTHLLPTREGFYLNNEIGLALVGNESAHSA